MTLKFLQKLMLSAALVYQGFRDNKLGKERGWGLLLDNIMNIDQLNLGLSQFGLICRFKQTGAFMKKIVWLSIAGFILMSGHAHALNCEVSYKARKINNDRFIFSDIPALEYKRGKVRGSGGTLQQCKDNALRSIINNNWRIIYAIEKAL